MNWFKNLFKSKESREAELNELRDRIAKELRDQLEAEQKLREEEEIRRRKEVEEQLLQERMNSTTPWYEPILGAEPSASLKDRYRWNQAFINSLVLKGFKGNSDEDIFSQFLEKQEEESRKAIIEAERERKKHSPEPWVEVVAEHITEDGKIQLELDWNAAFIHYLRKHGFRGATDEMLVHAWLGALEYESTGEEFI